MIIGVTSDFVLHAYFGTFHNSGLNAGVTIIISGVQIREFIPLLLSHLQADQGSYAVEKESPLYKAKTKFQDAVHLNPSDGVACYHLGRVSLLMGDKEAAKQYLMPAVALKPTSSPARFCLGIALPADSSRHAKPLLLHGLSEYLTEQQQFYEENSEPQKRTMKELHASKFYHGSNTLIVSERKLYPSLAPQPLPALLCAEISQAVITPTHLNLFSCYPQLF